MYRIKGKRESFYHQPESDEEFKYLLHCVSGIKTENPDPLILFRIQHELGNSRATNYVIPTLAHILFAMVLYGFPVQLSSPALTRPIWQMPLHYLYNHHRCNCLRIKSLCLSMFKKYIHFLNNNFRPFDFFSPTKTDRHSFFIQSLCNNSPLCCTVQSQWRLLTCPSCRPQYPRRRTAEPS